MNIPKMASWVELLKHQKKTSLLHSRRLFRDNETRFKDFSLTFGDLVFDYSKNHITKKTIKLLVNLAKERKVQEIIEAMFAGQNINTTENRPAFHVALRGSGAKIFTDEINEAFSGVSRFVNQILDGSYKGISGEKISDIVNIGIGGSHLGPEMVVRALRPFHSPDIRVHFVSNVDGHELSETLEKIKSSKTLFIIASKTFTTHETITNAKSARNWLVSKLGKRAVSRHFVAISANPKAAVKFGITPKLVFPMWDWVGGRFSVWSPIGLSVALQIGMQNFNNFLLGGHQMDEHFRHTPFHKNLPVLLALVGIWNRNFEKFNTLAILPYDQRLERFPAFIQQLDMESNGKSKNKKGSKANIMTGPIVFGETGSNSQHSFFQSLHQGSQPVPADFILVANPSHSLKEHHDQLLANALAQTRALMIGRPKKEADGDSFREFFGNRPTNTILLRALDPKTLGNLIALYEHKIFVQGIIWDINSFDQWGVELGKEMTKDILTKIRSPRSRSKLDSSTINLIKIIQRWQE